MRTRRRLAVATLTLAALATLGGPPAAAERSDGERLRYTVAEARAYSYRVSLRKEVIEAARNAEPCDPATDPYECDTTPYEHEPNCPPPIALGASGEAPEPSPPKGTQPTEGGADATAGAGVEPTMASSITLNELVAIGRLGRAGEVVESAGLASDSYVDLSGRQEPAQHTESDILPGVANVEERCLVEDPSLRSYRHYLSRSAEKTPATYHLAECFKDDCTFDRLLFSAETVEARSIVDLREQNGKVLGRLEAMFQDASWGGGAFTIDSLHTTVSFESDGTPGGLTWSVHTSVAGAELGGRAITLPTGQMIGNEELQVGVAAPYVSAAADGSALRIVAPGLAIASREQTVFLAGAEVDATFGRSARAPSLGVGGGTSDTASSTTDGSAGTDVAPGGAIGGGGGGGVDGGGGSASGGGGDVAAAPAAATPAERVSISRFSTGGLGVATILLFGLFAALWILFRWLGQFPEAREIYRLPPFNLMDRFYRAFLKS